MAKKQESSNAGKVVLGIAGLAAGALGAYFLYGSKDAKKNRMKAKSWMLKAKGEILEKIEDAKSVTESEYNSLVKEAVAKYKQLKKIDQSDVEHFLKDMKTHWDHFAKSVKKTVKKAS